LSFDGQLTVNHNLPALQPLKVPLQPEKEAQPAPIAAQRGLKTDELAQQVPRRYLEDGSRFVEAVNPGWGPRFAETSLRTKR
jgi:hypothetical protein